MSIILSFLALIIFSFVQIIWSIIMLFTQVDGRKWYYLIDRRHKRIAFLIDVFGNYTFKDFWNALLSKSGYKFGRLGETISSVLGKKQMEKSLTITGWFLLCIINFIDFTTWSKGGHCFYYIQTDEEIKKIQK